MWTLTCSWTNWWIHGWIHFRWVNGWIDSWSTYKKKTIKYTLDIEKTPVRKCAGFELVLSDGIKVGLDDGSLVGYIDNISEIYKLYKSVFKHTLIGKHRNKIK